MKQNRKVIGTFAMIAMLSAAQAGDLTINGNLTVTTNSIVNGQVGIGTSNPSAKLDVRPVLYSMDQSGGVQLATTDGHYPSGMFLRIDHSGIPRLAFDINSAELLSLNNSSGNVGIGTTYPTGGRLDVETSGSKIGVYGALSADNLGNVSAAAVKGIYTGNGTFGALGYALAPNGEFPAYYGVYGHATSGYAGYFEGPVSVSGDLSISGTTYGNTGTFTHIGIGTSAYTSVPLIVEEPQAYANLLSDSSVNGSVIQLINNASSPIYLGAINFINSSGNSVGQIGYQPGSPDKMNFRVGGADRAILSSAGLTVNGSTCCTSDRNAKERFSRIDAQDILKRVASLPISNWYYKQDAATRHVGPVAQDFYAAFNVGPDDKHIATVDEEGIALAAIQGLNKKLEAENAQLKTELKELRRSITKIEARLEQ